MEHAQAKDPIAWPNGLDGPTSIAAHVAPGHERTLAQPSWPRGWAYLSLPLLTWQRLDPSIALVEWRDGDVSTEAFDASIEYQPDTSTSFERVQHLFDTVLMGDSFGGVNFQVIVDTRQMSYTFATLHLAEWVRRVWQRPGWGRVRSCHLVVSGVIMPTLVHLAVAEHPRLRCHDTLEAACRACGIDPELVI